MSEASYLVALALLSLVLPAGWAWRQNTQAEASQTEQWLTSTARFFYFIGLPYLALITGLLPPRFLGLKSLENLIAINLGSDSATLLTSLQKAVTIILLECLADSGVVIPLGLMMLVLAAALRWGLARLGVEPPISPPTIGIILYHGLHWAFYRAIFWLLTGDLYLGVVAGAAWVLLEWALTAWVSKTHPSAKLSVLIQAILLILTSTIFLYAPNLWLLWPVHGAMAAILAWRMPERMVRKLS